MTTNKWDARFLDLAHHIALWSKDTSTKVGAVIASPDHRVVSHGFNGYLKGQEVFQDPRYNERWEGDQPIRERFWTQILRRAKVRYRKPYQTRHTYASMLLSSGENPWWIARQMGHSSLAMLEKHYGKWMPEAAPSAGMLAEKAFGQGVENVSITERNRSKYSE